MSDDADGDDHGHRQREAGEAGAGAASSRAPASAKPLDEPASVGPRRVDEERPGDECRRHHSDDRAPTPPAWRPPNPRALRRREPTTTFVPRTSVAATTATADHEPPSRRVPVRPAAMSWQDDAGLAADDAAPRDGRHAAVGSARSGSSATLRSGETSPTRTMRARAKPQTQVRGHQSHRVEIVVAQRGANDGSQPREGRGGSPCRWRLSP